MPQDTLDTKIKEVDKLTASIGALTAKFTALTESGESWSFIQKKIGSEINTVRQNFIDLVKSSEKVAKDFAKSQGAAEGTAERIADLQKKVKSLDSTYSTLVNKTLRELRKEQSAYKAQLKELAEQEKIAANQEKAIIKERQAAAREALKEIKERISQERAEKKRLYDEETKQIKELLRQQKNRLSEIDQADKRDRDSRKERIESLKKEFQDILRLNKQDTDAINKKEAANKKAAAAAEKAAEKQKFFGKAFTDAFSPQAIGKAAASIIKFISIYELLGRVISATIEFFNQSIQRFIDFDKNISRVAAVTGATGADLEYLQKEIRSVAVETRFTATEISELSIELGKLGVSARDIPKLLSPISIAAQATGEDLTSVGSAIVKVGNQFNLSASEAATTAAILTQAVNKSALTLEDFGVAIGYVGPLAAQSGLEFDKTAKILGILSDNGFSASRAGTGLRKILLELKKPGVDITQTLNDLASANISVAKAEELVGKTAAAQLVTILQNTDALNDITIAQEGFAEQLRATGVQMASFSGQLDILKSSYAEIQISVGEFLVQNEIVLTAIGLLSQKSENLARGFVIVKNESARLGDAFQKRLAEGLKAGNSELELLNRLLKDSDDENIKKVLDQLNKANPKNLKELNAELDKIERGPEWAETVISQLSAVNLWAGLAARGVFKLFSSTDETAKGFKGLTSEFTNLTNEQKKSVNIQRGVKDVNEQYLAQVDAIKAITDSTTQQAKAQELSTKLKSRANLAEKQGNELLQSSNSLERGKGNVLIGRAKQYRVLVSALSEYTTELEKKEKAEKDPTDKYLAVFRQQKKALDLELSAIKDRADEEDKAFKKRVKSINEFYDLELQLAEGNIAKTTELNINKSKELTEASEIYEASLYNIGGAIKDWDVKSQDFFKRYQLLFKGSEKNTLMLQNTNEQFGQNLENLAQKLTSFNENAQRDVNDLANELIGSGIQLVSGFSQGLKELEKNYSNTAYGQVKLSEAQRRYVSELREQQKELENFYNTFKDQLSPEQLAKLETAIAIVSKTVNDAVNGIIDDKTVEQLKRKYLELGAAFGENFSLGIDLKFTDGLKMALDSALQAVERFNDVSFENTKNRLQKEKDALKNQADIEDSILNAKLQGQLITEAEYRAQVEKNRKKEIQAQNKIDKQIFDAEQKRDRQGALADYLSALGSIIPNLIVTNKVGDPVQLSLKYAISAALASFSYGNELRAINKRQFFPTKFAEGGMVYGPSHSEGGVPFTVQGQGGYEMEGGEYIVNKKATQRYKSLLDQINGYGKSNYKFAAGGVVKDPTEVANRQIELLEAIASANISMVGKLDKPVRAFVATTDLRSDENARRTQERNSQL